MAYTPELSRKHSRALRRIAWALDLPMTRAIGEIFDYIGNVIDSTRVCDACRDRTKCNDCVFSRS